ncbi:MAG: aldehyde dehydrogenase family protein [Propionibacteriaceae bacterium]
MLTLVSTPPSVLPTASVPLTIRDPRDGSLVGSVNVSTDDEIAVALGQVRATAASWAATEAGERADAVRDMADLLAGHADELARLQTSETGCPLPAALAGVADAVAVLHSYAELGPLHHTPSSTAGPTTSYTLAGPRGVVLVLTPWNDAVTAAATLIGAAVVAGNVVIHKPSEHCPHLGLRVGELLATAVPDGVLATLIGGAGVGSVLANSSGIDVVAHVGSAANGRRVSAAAARTGAHVIRLNGGNDALLIDADVDPEWAAELAARGAFAHGGQTADSVERILVHADIAEPFLAALVELARNHNDDDPVAPLISQSARQLVHRQVITSLRAGAVVLEGGCLPHGPGSHYPATVVTGCPVDSPLMTEETYGPVAAVHVVDDFETGLVLAAIDGYGKSATVLTGSLAHINDAVATLPVGTVKINDVTASLPGMAAQPRGSSGTGFGHGPELLDELTTRKVVHVALPVLGRPSPGTAA